MRPAVLVPAVLAVLLIVAIVVAARETWRADDERPEAAPAPTAAAQPVPPPQAAQAVSPPPAAQAVSPPPAAQAVSPPPAAVIGAACAPAGTTATTDYGATAYCATLQTTGASIWSLTAGDIPGPTVTVDPTEAPLSDAEESPVRVCMQQTQMPRLRCLEDIRRSNRLRAAPPA